MIFFLAPFAGLVIGVFRVILFRNREIPYGPFLCLAALFLIVFWDSVWQSDLAQWVYGLGWLVPCAMAACLVLLGGMLGLWRLILAVIRPR